MNSSAWLACALACTGLAQSQALARPQGTCPSLLARSEAVLHSPTPDADFGRSVAASGDWALVSGRGQFGQSPAVIFRRGPGGWVAGRNLGFGVSVSLEGDRAVVGHRWLSGSVSVFDRVGATWPLAQTVFYAGGRHDDFGEAVAIQGPVLAVGIPDDLVAFGTIEVFDEVGGTWVSRYFLTAVRRDMGETLAMDGRWLVSGANGAAAIFDLGRTSWTVQPLFPGAAGQAYGDAVAVSGDTVAVSDPERNGSAGQQTGVVFLFDYDGTQWVRCVELEASDAQPFDRFGSSVALDGDRLLVGAQGVDGPSGTFEGAAYVFERSGGTWTEVLKFGPDPSAPGAFGQSASLDGDLAVVGSAGAATAFRLFAPIPPTSYCTAGTTSNGCRASISGNGTPSGSAGSGFTLSVGQMEGGKSGILFYGTSGPSDAPWSAKSTSFLCVGAPTQRTGVQFSGGTNARCDGSMSLDWNAFVASKPGALGRPFVGGETIWAQGWFRDAPSPKTTSLSDGLTFSVCP